MKGGSFPEFCNLSMLLENTELNSTFFYQTVLKGTRSHIFCLIFFLFLRPIFFFIYPSPNCLSRKCGRHSDRSARRAPQSRVEEKNDDQVWNYSWRRNRQLIISYCESRALSENSARYDVTVYVTMFQNR